MAEARIKGFALRGLLRYVKVSGHSGGIADILQRLTPGAQETFKAPISSSAWYPYEAFTGLARTIDRTLGRGDLTLCRQIGSLSAEQDLNGVFKIVLSLTSPQTIAARGSILWGRYCDTGKLEPIDADKGKYRVRLVSFPDIAREHCVLIEGWMERAGRMSGARELAVRHECCVHKRDPFCEWAGTWAV